MSYKSFPKKYFAGNTKEFVDIKPYEMDECLPRYRIKYLKSFIMSLPLNAKILDAGCGMGKAARIVHVYRPDIEIYAMDISDVEEFLPSGVIFKKGSIENLSDLYEPNFFDGIISLHVIEHLLFPIDMMNGLHNVLKPGGRVFIETPNWTRLFTPFSYMFFWNDYTHVRPFSIFSMTKLFIEFKLKPIHIISTRAHESFFVNKKMVDPHSDKKSSAIEANHARGFFMRAIGKVINPFIKDIIIAIGEKK